MILITGIVEFIGMQLALRFLHDGHEAMEMDRLGRAARKRLLPAPAIGRASCTPPETGIACFAQCYRHYHRWMA
jgi:nucleoside-diphosphate-sugar epimerase